MSLAEAARLTDAYRIDQARIAGQAAARVAAAVDAILDPGALDASFQQFLTVARAQIAAGQVEAASRAVRYFLAHRHALIGADVPLLDGLVREIVLNEAQLTISMSVTGPIAVKRQLLAGAPVETAMARARTATAGAAYRMVANAARDTLMRNVERDRYALGFRRVTDGNPCAFCAMLAGRGAVYTSKEAAIGRGSRYHDFCGCTVEAVYRRDQPPPPGQERFADMWAESGARTLADFRRWYAANAGK